MSSLSGVLCTHKFASLHRSLRQNKLVKVRPLTFSTLTLIFQSGSYSLCWYSLRKVVHLDQGRNCGNVLIVRRLLLLDKYLFVPLFFLLPSSLPLITFFSTRHDHSMMFSGTTPTPSLWQDSKSSLASVSTQPNTSPS
jgi:hypothetical protein